MNFQVEVLNRCDLSCIECPTRLIQRRASAMQDEVWHAILHRYIRPYWRLHDHLNPPTFIPHKDCEPLLHKKLPEKLREVADALPEMHIDIYTHGLHLPKLPDFIPFLGTLPNKVRLLVSFHFHNHDGTTNDYTQTSAYLRDVIRHRPANVEIILASHLIAPMTRERLDEWRESWRTEMDMGVSVHANVAINTWTGLIDAGTEHPPGCPYERFDHVFFGVTGNILPCCMDLEEEIVFGNVLTADPEEIMGTLGAFYAAQRRHEVNHDLCRACFNLPPVPKLQQLGVIA